MLFWPLFIFVAFADAKKIISNENYYVLSPPIKKLWLIIIVCKDVLYKIFIFLIELLACFIFI